MIQRIQTLFLFFAFLLNGSVFFNALYRQAMNDPSQWIGLTFAIVLTAAALMPLVCILLYKSRSNQLRWVKITLLIQVIMVGLGSGILFTLGGFGTFLWDETIGLLLLVAAFSAELYARKKIRDDIELVKSMDRIR